MENSTTAILHQSNQHIFQHQSSVTSSASIQTVLHHGTTNMSNSTQSQLNGSGSLSSSLNNVIQHQQYHQMNNNSSNVSSAEEVVLNVGDVADLLHPQFAIITGGRSKEGCPLITFPDHNNFLTLGDVEYQRLVFYLTSVPS